MSFASSRKSLVLAATLLCATLCHAQPQSGDDSFLDPWATPDPYATPSATPNPWDDWTEPQPYPTPTEEPSPIPSAGTEPSGTEPSETEPSETEPATLPTPTAAPATTAKVTTRNVEPRAGGGLDSILVKMPGKSYSNVQAVQGFKYSSTQLETKTFSGSFTATSSMTKLAIKYNDGCDVSVNGKKLIANFNQPVVGYAEVPTTLTPGKSYQIQVQYSNVLYAASEGSNTNGVTLFAYGNAPNPNSFRLIGLTADGAVRVTSITGDQQIIHFATPKGAANSRVTLRASISPDNSRTRARFNWQGATPNTSNRLVASVSKSSANRFVIAIRNGTTVVKRIRVWVIWCTISGSVNDPTATLKSSPYGGRPVRVGTSVSAYFSSQATVQPLSIITDANRPNFSGANTVTPPGGPNANGTSLSAGANRKWDMSRRIARRMNVTAANPPLNLPAQDVAINFPANRVVGNDDASPNDENNNPYPKGTLTSTDRPKRTFYLQGGVVSHTYNNRTWFQEFVRLQIGNNWYVVSNPLYWRVEFRLRKNQVTEVLWQIDVNGDGDRTDNITEAMLGQDKNGNGDTRNNVGFWASNGSIAQNNNSGAPH